MNTYKALKQNKFSRGHFSIIPLRQEDKYKIMEWRNEQIYHLRQTKKLTKEEQEVYFKNVVSKLFVKEKPDQLLFSFLKGDQCIGYGGLVHINWNDKNAEISFIMETSLEEKHFENLWITYLSLIEEVAFQDLEFHKIYTYAFNLRPRLYTALVESGFDLEAQLKEHSFFNGRFIDVKIHSKLNRILEIKKATKDDLMITFNWATNKEVRRFAYNKNDIAFDEHKRWFLSSINDPNCKYYMFMVNGNAAGSIRFDIVKQKLAKINYLLDPSYFGKGLGVKLLDEGIKFLKMECPEIEIVYGYVFPENRASVRIFEKLSFRKSLEKNSELKFEKKLI
ncbi:MAG: GNAT family N-acetyltransferase [Christiangramia sp.]